MARHAEVARPRPMAADSLSWSLAATEDAPRQARSRLATWGTRLEPDAMDTAQLLISELIALVLRSPDGAGDEAVDVCVELDAERLRAEVVREAGRFGFHDAAAGMPDLALTLLDAFSYVWGLSRSDKGTVCWAEIAVGRDASPQRLTAARCGQARPGRSSAARRTHA